MPATSYEAERWQFSGAFAAFLSELTEDKSCRLDRGLACTNFSAKKYKDGYEMIDRIRNSIKISTLIYLLLN